MAAFAADGVIDELHELERRGWRSLCDGTGAEFYGELMTDDAVMILAHGHALTRDEVVASLSAAPPWERYEIEDARIIPLSDDAATLVYTGKGHRADEAPFVALMSSTYVRCHRRWRLALYQQTPIMT